ncbi:MAG: mannose-6-phosphate isomerase, class I [Arthrobacter sp.]|uniref:mannose-6-phosphate isomerase, class I n=1 Tax=Arthrobacter sp. TaxID=1667 RepID=UPI00348CBBDA
MHRLTNVVRDYPWGSTTAMAELFGREPGGAPEAELWIGAHPDSPSTTAGPDGAPIGLDELIAADPEGTLGREAAERFGRLPFLAKVLAAGAPLSLQVHPSREQARSGFAAEEAAGVGRTAPDRNYRDDNHKPEMIFALTPFTALCGFREAAESANLFERLAAAVARGAEAGPAGGGDAGAAADAARRTASALRAGDLRSAFTTLLEGGPGVVALVAAATAAVEADPALAGADPGLAELPALAAHHPGDPGVVVSLLLNHVSLEPGQAVYLPAGNVHAYLRGLGIEVMASSDNVLRGGLTGKHVDLPELLATVEFRALPVPHLAAEATGLGQELYRPPFEEFQLQRIRLAGDGDGGGTDPGDGMAGGDVPVAQNGPVVVVCVRGELLLDSPRGDERLRSGDAVFVGSSESPVMAKRMGAAEAVAFAVTLP